MEGDIPPFNAVSQTLIPFSEQTSSIRLIIASCKSIFSLLSDFVEFYNHYKEKPEISLVEFYDIDICLLGMYNRIVEFYERRTVCDRNVCWARGIIRRGGP